MTPAQPATMYAAAVVAAVVALAHANAFAETVPLASESSPVVAGAETAGAQPAALDSSAAGGWESFETWIETSYARAPALVLGLSALVVLPPLAVLGLLIQRSFNRLTDATQIHSRGRRPAARDDERTSLTERAQAWPSQAWIEVEGANAPRHDIGRSVVRIGRDGDNDICLADKTVHRYHALIHRTDDAGFVITDLSSADGNGVAINGKRLAEARLRDGDLIELGLARLKFVARPA